MKIGDRVRVKPCSYATLEGVVGEVGVIKLALSHEFIVEINALKYDFYEHELEVIE